MDDDVTRKRREIGKRLARARADRELLIEGARAKLGAITGDVPSRFTWMRWERGAAPIPADVVPALARVLDVDIAWLLTGRAVASAAAA